ncbi:aminotransferase class I/II-fold pyridoxal phosphate-dependent enzyme [Candidatus Vidania fulgoroideorum]
MNKELNLKKIFGKKKKRDVDLSIGEGKYKNKIFNKYYKKFYLYPKTNGKKYLLKNISNWLKKRYKIKKKLNIIPTIGNRESLFTSFMFFNKRSKINNVVYKKPYYPMYKKISNFFKINETFIKKNFFLELKNITKKKKIDLIIICNPNNPTGEIIKYEELLKISLLSKKKKFFIISDECYSEIYYKKKPRGIIECFIENKLKLDNLIILNSLSKRSCLPGLRSGFILTSKNNIKKISNIKMMNGTSMSNFIQFLSSKAWKDEKNASKIRNKYKKKMNICFKFLKNKLIFKKPDSGFYFWIKIKKYKINDIDFCKLLYNKKKIRVFPGTIMGKKNYIRIAMVEKTIKCIYSIKYIYKLLKKCLKKK